MKILLKYGFFTFIYILLTWLFSDDLTCVLDMDRSCLSVLMGKYIIFMILMIIYDKWIKKMIFGFKKNKNN